MELGLGVAKMSKWLSPGGGLSGGGVWSKAFQSLNLKAARTGVAVGTYEMLLIAHLMCPSIVFCVIKKMSNLSDFAGGAESTNPVLAAYFSACATVTAKSFHRGLWGAGVGGRRSPDDEFDGRYCRTASPVGVAGCLPLTFRPTQ